MSPDTAVCPQGQNCPSWEAQVSPAHAAGGGRQAVTCVVNLTASRRLMTSGQAGPVDTFRSARV